jgi:hypothetical protein
MKHSFFIVFGLIAQLGASLVVSSSFAAPTAKHFEFKVPVLFDMVAREDVSDSAVICEAHKGQPMTESTLIGKGRTGAGMSGFIDPNKGTTSTMDMYVKFNADKGKDPREATHYRCYLELIKRGKRCAPGVSTDRPEWCTPAKDTDAPLVEGTF